MPLEVELCAVPHLKGLINAEIYIVDKRVAVVLHWKKTHLLSPILPHTEPRPYFNIAGSVCSLKLQNCQNNDLLMFLSKQRPQSFPSKNSKG